MKILELVGILQMLNKYILFLIFLFFPISLFSQGDTLDLAECINIAIKNNPQIGIYEGNYEGSRANVTLARSVFFPQISVTSSGVRNGGTFFMGPTSRVANYNNFALGFQGQMLLFDFGKSIFKLSSSSYQSEASEYDLKNTKQTIELNTVIAYYNYLQSKKINEVTKEICNQAEEHLKQSKSFFEVGKKPQFDVLKAETDLANAKLNYIRSNNNVKLSRIQLANVLGIELKDNIEFKDDLSYTKDTIFVLRDAIEIALNNRPDLLAQKFRKEAMSLLVKSNWLSNLPSISFSGGYNFRGYELDKNFKNSWSLGLSLSLPLFQGWAIDATVESAKASLKSSEHQYDNLKQQVILDVEQQFLNYEEAKERIDVSEKLVKQAEETFKLAKGRYNSEVGSAIEITDAQITLLNAQISYIQALYDVRIALAKLKKAIGY